MTIRTYLPIQQLVFTVLYKKVLLFVCLSALGCLRCWNGVRTKKGIYISRLLMQLMQIRGLVCSDHEQNIEHDVLVKEEQILSVLSVIKNVTLFLCFPYIYKNRRTLSLNIYTLKNWWRIRLVHYQSDSRCRHQSLLRSGHQMVYSNSFKGYFDAIQFQLLCCYMQDKIQWSAE